ncbi:MAG: hypothetical protein AB9891_00145 [Anaerolineaceae bacterium]
MNRRCQRRRYPDCYTNGCADSGITTEADDFSAAGRPVLATGRGCRDGLRGGDQPALGKPGGAGQLAGSAREPGGGQLPEHWQRPVDRSQNGIYYRMTWWVVLAESESNARFLYGASQNPEYAKSAFLLVMPAAIKEKMDVTTPIEIKNGRCNDAAVSSYVSDTYAAFRQGGIMPTLGPAMSEMPGNNTPEELAKLPPDLFLFASCRVNNAVILFWGHAPHNYDGKNSPIPDDVIAGQVREKFDLVIDKLTGNYRRQEGN